MDCELEEVGCGLWLEEPQDGDTEILGNDLAQTLCPQPFGVVSVPQPSDVVPHMFSFGLIGDESFCKEENSGNDLCAPVSARVQVFSTKVSTFLDEPEQTCSKDAQWRDWAPLLVLLLSEMLNDDSIWWLLDSGASATVLSESSLKEFGVVSVNGSPDSDRYRAANGSAVTMRGVTELSVWMLLSNKSQDGRSRDWKKARLTALVGSICHNIMSTTVLCSTGWEFHQHGKGFSVKHKQTGMEMTECAYFAGCPWIRLHPDMDTERPSASQADMVVSSGEVGGELEQSVNPLSKAARNELEVHRSQGRTPFHPNCVECVRGRSVFSHRRRTEEGLQCEVQADFCFLNHRGEVLMDDQSVSSIKFLVLTEMVSNAVGYVVIGDDERGIGTDITTWIDAFGLTSDQNSIVFHTDSERAVSALVTRACSKHNFLVRKAAPQQHRSVGGAERCVRRLKESLAVLRADLNKDGVDIVFGPESVKEVLTYLALVQNHFGKSPESDYTPLETIAGRRLSKPVSALYGSTVLAELPDSVRFKSPNETRSIEAAFLHTGMDHGAQVQGFVRFEDELVLHRFTARNVGPVYPIAWNEELCPGLLIGSGSEVVPGSVPVVEGGGQGHEVIPMVPDAAAAGVPRESSASASSGQHVLAGRPSLKRGGEQSGEAIAPPTKHVRWDLPYSPVPSPSTPLDDGEQPVGVPEGHSSSSSSHVFPPTRSCPACSSGMEAPGIRHSAHCRRLRAKFDQEHGVQVDTPRLTEYRDRFKRPSETDVVDLEKSIKESKEELESELMISSLDMTCFETGVSVEFGHVAGAPLVSELLVDETVSSIQFDAPKKHENKKMPLGGAHVLVWAPDQVIDDSSLESLDPQLGFQGKQEEIANLEKLMGEAEVQTLKKNHPQARIIPSRWVCAKKSPTKVRTRIVAKDISKGSSARALGYSSPTPSCEALFLVIVIGATHDWRMRSLDISHAFMHSPLPSSNIVILRLPQSVSHLDGSVSFLWLGKALNGLRDASLHWLTLLGDTVKSQGLWSDELEPCLYQGEVFDNQGHSIGYAVLLVYADDILVVSSSAQAEESITAAIGRVVPTKVTGQILPSDQKGGKLTFIGRELMRHPGEKAVVVPVNPQYLEPAFKDFGIEKGTQAVPDIASLLEKQDAVSKKPLSPEGYQRFRKALGKLIWLGQTRSDLKLWLSLVGTQQATPTQSTEAALKAILQYLFWDRYTVLKIPSPEYHQIELEEHQSMVAYIHALSDASHAPYKFNARKGITGGVMMVNGGLVRSLAKQQQATALSSCEAEVYAVQTVAQESVALSNIIHRVFFGLHLIDEREMVEIVLESDSASAIQLVGGLDLPRRSRHIDIRLEWLRCKISDKQLRLKFRRGQSNVSDLFTKCLGINKDFLRHRTVLGFMDSVAPLQELLMLGQSFYVSAPAINCETGTGGNVAPAIGKFLFVEVCCEEFSNLRRACETSKIPYVGVFANMERSGVMNKLKEVIHGRRGQGLLVHVHVSTPCKTGSPLLRFVDKTELTNEEQREWEAIMKASLSYLELGDTISFELPKFNNIWGRPQTVKVLEKANITFEGIVMNLRQCGHYGNDGLPFSKKLVFASNSQEFCGSLNKRFNKCKCEKHAALTTISFTQTGIYSPILARGIINATKAAMKKETTV